MQLENKDSVFSQQYRVYYEDTDAGGVVYHSNYINYMERVRTEWLRHLGYTQSLLAKQDVLFVVHSLAVRYVAPAYLDDELRVTAMIKELKRASIVFLQQIYRVSDNVLLAEGEVKVSCVSCVFKPRALPKDFAEKCVV